jgi:hypothetical protein
MSPRPLTKRVSIYLTVNSDSISRYFNPNDPAPLYCRQLSHDFQDYLDNSVAIAGRYSTINYKVFCNDANMKFLVAPLLQTIRRHYRIQKQLKKNEFRKFKKRNFFLLFISGLIVMFCQGVLPSIFGQSHRIHSMFSNALDVFSWVILWKPIERLIFNWNPYLKEILLISKMELAEALIIDNEQELVNYHMDHIDAA